MEDLMSLMTQKKNLKDIQRELGLSDAEFCVRLNISQATLVRIKGGKKVSRRTAVLIARSLGMDLSQLDIAFS